MLGYTDKNIHTKETIHIRSIGMGRSKKEYRPDYLLSINKIPIVAIDTKHPDDDPDNGLKDALMYARTTNNGSIENLTKLRYNRITSPIY